MRILFITTAHNSLSQRLTIELTRRGHAITLCIGSSPAGMLEAVERHSPDLILAPMLKTAIPEQVWQHHRCLIVHPGIKGDRGPSSLDWAITSGIEERWGVTVLQAEAEMEARPIWGAETFPMPHQPITKSSLYRAEVTESAVKAVLQAVARVAGRAMLVRSVPLNPAMTCAVSCVPPCDSASVQSTGLTQSTQEIARHVRGGRQQPGLCPHDAHRVTTCTSTALTRTTASQVPPDVLIGQRHGAVCVGTVDGAVWLTHIKVRAADHRYTGIKLPATQVLRGSAGGNVPHIGRTRYENPSG